MSVLQSDAYHEYESSVSPKGQITLPNQTRKQLGINARDKVTIKVFEDGRMIIEPQKSTIYSHYRTAPALPQPLSIEEMREIAYTEAYQEDNL